MDWRIWYENGTEYTSADGPPHTAPAWGVQAIEQAPPHDQLFNKDFYLWREDYGCWIEVDIVGLIDHLTSAAGQVTALVVGRTVPHPTFSAAMRQLNEG